MFQRTSNFSKICQNQAFVEFYLTWAREQIAKILAFTEHFEFEVIMRLICQNRVFDYVIRLDHLNVLLNLEQLKLSMLLELISNCVVKI